MNALMPPRIQCGAEHPLDHSSFLREHREIVVEGIIEDPLRQFALGKSNDALSIVDDSERMHPMKEAWKNWNSNVIQNYTTDKRIPVVLSRDCSDNNSTAKPTALNVDRAKSRLEQLEIETEAQARVEFKSQKEYMDLVRRYETELNNVWDQGEKIFALKIAIRAAQMLRDTSVPAFYPSMFCLITDLLNKFGTLVYERLKSCGGSSGVESSSSLQRAVALPDQFDHMHVSEQGQETCRNWFFKISCIRELTSRLYVEIALLPCYRFIVAQNELAATVLRLVHTARGIADPVAAAYVQAYLAFQASISLGDCATDSVLDAFGGTVYCITNRTTEDSSMNYNVVEPAVSWIVHCIGGDSNASEANLNLVLNHYRDYCHSNAAVLNPIISSFNPALVSRFAEEFLILIRECDVTSLPQYELYCSLGRALVIHAPETLSERLVVLNKVFRVVSKMDDPESYTSVDDEFIEFVLFHFTEKEVNIMLGDTLIHVRVNDGYQRVQPKLYSILTKVLEAKKHQFASLIAMEHFMSIFDLITNPTLRKDISFAMFKRLYESQARCSDPLFVHAMLQVLRSLTNSFDELTTRDDVASVTRLVCNFFSRIDYGDDLERSLLTYTDCRSACQQLDDAIGFLVIRVCSLAMDAHSHIGGIHTHKTLSFVKACIAYCSISIPSINIPIERKIHLCRLVAQIALINGLPSHAQDLIKYCITVMAQYLKTENKDSSLIWLKSTLSPILSFLIVCPGPLEGSPFMLVQGVCNSLVSLPSGSLVKIELLADIVRCLCALVQADFPIHVPGIISNDRLFACSKSYMQHAHQLVDAVLDRIYDEYSLIVREHGKSHSCKISRLSHNLIEMILCDIELNHAAIDFIVKLSANLDERDRVNTSAHIRVEWKDLMSTKGLSDVLDVSK